MSTLSLVDQLMVGQIGSTAVASVGIGAQVTMLVSVVVTALSTAVGAFTAQFAATGQTGQVRGALRYASLVAMCIAAPVVVVGAIAPAFLVRPFTADPHLEVTGAPYLRLVALWVLPTAVILVCTAIMRSMGETKLPLQAAAAAIFVNLFLDWVLIFGNLGAPRLGLVGAGVGSLVARLSECVCIVIAMMRLLGAKGWGKRMPAAMRRKIRDAALPLVLTELIWVLSENTYVAVYGRIGTEALAAMTMTYPVQGIVMGLFSGLAAASVPVLGDDLGHERRDKALVDARALLRIGIVGAAVVAMIVALLAPFYVHAYSVTPSTATLSEACLWVFSAYLVAKVGNLVMSGGILPAGGDTRYQLVMESLATWLLVFRCLSSRLADMGRVRAAERRGTGEAADRMASGEERPLDAPLGGFGRPQRGGRPMTGAGLFTQVSRVALWRSVVSTCSSRGCMTATWAAVTKTC